MKISRLRDDADFSWVAWARMMRRRRARDARMQPLVAVFKSARGTRNGPQHFIRIGKRHLHIGGPFRPAQQPIAFVFQLRRYDIDDKLVTLDTTINQNQPRRHGDLAMAFEHVGQHDRIGKARHKPSLDATPDNQLRHPSLPHLKGCVLFLFYNPPAPLVKKKS